MHVQPSEGIKDWLMGHVSISPARYILTFGVEKGMEKCLSL
jgi:hypothetical protein